MSPLSPAKEKQTFGLGENLVTNRFVVTPQQDAEYRAAVECGNMRVAQRMVDEAAKCGVLKVGTKWSRSGEAAEVMETFIWLNEDRVNAGVFRYPAQVERAVENGESIWSYLNQNMLPFFDADMGGERDDLIKWFLAQNEKIDAISTGKAEVSKPPFYGDNERGRALMHGVEAYAKLRAASLDPVIYDAEGQVTPLSQRFNPEQAY